MNSSLTKSGDPDMRFSCNRTPGYNKDGTLDMRYKKNRKWDIFFKKYIMNNSFSILN